MISSARYEAVARGRQACVPVLPYRPRSDSADEARRKPALGFILATVFLDAVSFGLVIPILPKLILRITGDTDFAAGAFGLFSAFYGAPRRSRGRSRGDRPWPRRAYRCLLLRP